MSSCRRGRGRSRTCPPDASTRYFPFRYFDIVFAFEGDSTMIRSMLDSFTPNAASPCALPRLARRGLKRLSLFSPSVPLRPAHRTAAQRLPPQFTISFFISNAVNTIGNSYGFMPLFCAISVTCASPSRRISNTARSAPVNTISSVSLKFIPKASPMSTKLSVNFAYSLISALHPTPDGTPGKISFSFPTRHFLPLINSKTVRFQDLLQFLRLPLSIDISQISPSFARLKAFYRFESSFVKTT